MHGTTMKKSVIRSLGNQVEPTCDQAADKGTHELGGTVK